MSLGNSSRRRVLADSPRGYLAGRIRQVLTGGSQQTVRWTQQDVQAVQALLTSGRTGKRNRGL